MSTSPSTHFLELIKNRRSIYQLSNTSPIPDSQILNIVNAAVLHTPSSFNSQSTRVLVLLGEEHEALWDLTKEVLSAIVPAATSATTETKLAGFRGGYGTILFFGSRSVVASMQARFPSYADKFPPWATQSSGMTQFTIWTALEADGLGCNLQHYNPLIDAKVAAKWDVDADWQLRAQLVFGTPTGEPRVKTFEGLEKRVRVAGQKKED